MASSTTKTTIRLPKARPVLRDGVVVMGYESINFPTTTKLDEAALSKIQMRLSTRKGERIRQPYYGLSNIEFEQADEDSLLLMRDDIYTQLSQIEEIVVERVVDQLDANRNQIFFVVVARLKNDPSKRFNLKVVQ